MIETFEPLQKFMHGQGAVAVAFNAALLHGASKVANEVEIYCKSALEAQAALLQKLVGAQSTDEMLILQSNYAKARVEASLAGSKRLGELVAETVKEALVALSAGLQHAPQEVRVPTVGRLAEAAE